LVELVLFSNVNYMARDLAPKLVTLFMALLRAH